MYYLTMDKDKLVKHTFNPLLGGIKYGVWDSVHCDRINDMYRFPRLLTAFSSGSRFEFPMALVVKASQDRKFRQN
jgi:hypothetical protein